MDVFDWIEAELRPEPVPSTELIYDHMESQSGRCLPLIYQPFDLGDPAHWSDRGHVFDYLHATCAEEGRILDFGPGDGWPSLILAPFVREVVGVDASEKRVQVCRENARRMGIRNVRFLHVPPGEPLPFADGSFAGACAASSLEQTPDPRAAAAEIARVLRPEGALRMHYEALGMWRDGLERELKIFDSGEERRHLLLYDRREEAEWARMVRLDLRIPDEPFREDFLREGKAIAWEDLELELLERHREAVFGAFRCDLTHPSGPGWASLLAEVGFREVRGTPGGGDLALVLFQDLPEEERPASMEELDRLLQPLVAQVLLEEMPLEEDPMILAQM